VPWGGRDRAPASPGCARRGMRYCASDRTSTEVDIPGLESRPPTHHAAAGQAATLVRGWSRPGRGRSAAGGCVDHGGRRRGSGPDADEEPADRSPQAPLASAANLPIGPLAHGDAHRRGQQSALTDLIYSRALGDAPRRGARGMSGFAVHRVHQRRGGEVALTVSGVPGSNERVRGAPSRRRG
jgi:hypothetical protein